MLLVSCAYVVEFAAAKGEVAFSVMLFDLLISLIRDC